LLDAKIPKGEPCLTWQITAAYGYSDGKQIAMRYSYTYNTGNTEYKLRVAGIKGRHQKAICWFCDSSNEGRLTARERSKRFAGMIVRPWEVSQTMSQLLTDAPRDLPCNISCRKSHCMATGEDRTIAK